MDNQYSTLQILAAAVRELPNPTAYFCTPRELILRSNDDWAAIYSHLQLLETEYLVEIMNADSVRFSITQKGLDIAALMVNKAGAVLELLKGTKLS